MMPMESGQRPDARGRSAVRFMRASVERSRAWLRAPAPAEMSPMPNSVSSRPRCKVEMPDCIDPR
jgi:hypothetical protein